MQSAPAWPDATPLSACRRLRDLLRRAPNECGIENAREMRGVRASRGLCVHLLSSDRLHRCGTLVCVPARHDAVEIAKVRHEVEGETVTDDRPVQLDTDRGQVFAA